MLINILILLAVIVIGLVVFVVTRPSEFRIMRSAVVGAPPDAVFPQVNELHNWEAWSPWAKLDPAAKTTYEGPAAGVGAAFSWAGNHNVGEGKMTITDSQPNDHIQFRLDFLKPFKGTNTAVFTFQPERGQTKVTWTMSGHYGFVPKLMGLFISCDKMVGDQFEKGLADLNKVATAVVHR